MGVPVQLGLQGTIWPSISKKIPNDHPNLRRQGARLLSCTGDQIFLDPLHAFPKGFPFRIKIANVYIEGGERIKKGCTVLRWHRPKMTAEALKTLLARHGREILDDANDNDNTRHTNAANASAIFSQARRKTRKKTF